MFYIFKTQDGKFALCRIERNVQVPVIITDDKEALILFCKSRGWAYRDEDWNAIHLWTSIPEHIRFTA